MHQIDKIDAQGISSNKCQIILPLIHYRCHLSIVIMPAVIIFSALLFRDGSDGIPMPLGMPDLSKSLPESIPDHLIGFVEETADEDVPVWRDDGMNGGEKAPDGFYAGKCCAVDKSGLFCSDSQDLPLHYPREIA